MNDPDNQPDIPHLTFTTIVQPRIGATHSYTTSTDTTPPEKDPPGVEALANALAGHIHLLKQELKTLRESIK